MALGDLATWVGAIATVGLLVGAVITARYAIKAFHDQHEEVKLLGQQLAQTTEQLNRDEERRKRVQAGNVSVEAPPTEQKKGSSYLRFTAMATVHNRSLEPISRLEAVWYMGDDQLEGSDEDKLSTLMPNESSRPFERTAKSPALRAGGVCFDDAVGIRWRRWPDGKLEEWRPPSDVPPAV